MRLPDGTVLMHEHAPYDPVKAHEYYLRTRQLKGRRKGSAQPFQSTVQRVKKPTTYTVKTADGKTHTVSEQQLAEQRAYAAKRVTEIKSKLAELSNKLKALMAEAEKKKAAAKPPTAAEKAKAAREAKLYRQSHRTNLLNKSRAAARKKAASSPHKPKGDPVKELQTRIVKIKGALDAAVAKQRALASATKNG